MTDSTILASNNIKDFGKLSSGNHKVVSYPCFPKEEQEREYLTSIESITPCSDRICIECNNDHSFRGKFEDARIIIDLLPELFPEIFKNCSFNKLQEFVN